MIKEICGDEEGGGRNENGDKHAIRVLWGDVDSDKGVIRMITVIKMVGGDRRGDCCCGKSDKVIRVVWGDAGGGCGG